MSKIGPVFVVTCVLLILGFGTFWMGIAIIKTSCEENTPAILCEKTSEGGKLLAYCYYKEEQVEEIPFKGIFVKNEMSPSNVIAGRYKYNEIWTYICPRCNKVVHNGNFLGWVYIQCPNCELVFCNRSDCCSILKSSPKWVKAEKEK